MSSKTLINNVSCWVRFSVKMICFCHFSTDFISIFNFYSFKIYLNYFHQTWCWLHKHCQMWTPDYINFFNFLDIGITVDNSISPILSCHVMFVVQVHLRVSFLIVCMQFVEFPLENISFYWRHHHYRWKDCQIKFFLLWLWPLSREGIYCAIHSCCDIERRFRESHPKFCPWGDHIDGSSSF